MNISAKPNSGEFTASAATKLENGSKVSALELTKENLQNKRSKTDTSHSARVPSQGLSSIAGIGQRQPPCSTRWGIHGPITVLNNSGIGQTLIDANGNAIAWTTSVIVASVICELLNEDEGLLVAVPRHAPEVTRRFGSQPKCQTQIGPKRMRNYDRFDPETSGEEYELGYEIIRWAMTQITVPELQFLRNAMSKATCFLHDELEEQEDVTKDLGLDEWLKFEEQQRADQEEWEREQEDAQDEELLSS